MTTAQFTVSLHRALRVVNLSAALHGVLTAIAIIQEQAGFATVPGVCARLGVTVNAVHLHLHKSANLIAATRPAGHGTNQLRLTVEAVALLAKVNRMVTRYTADEATKPKI